MMGVSNEAMESITGRLSLMEDLYFPRNVQTATPSDRKSLLLDLLSRDVAVFLERYGSELTLEELNEFDILKDDYEINWHLKHLRSIICPTEEDMKSKFAKIKNRRLAYMDRLIIDGNYFSEDAMREREPYLHHEYLGKFQDLSGRRMARPGERWSETLIRRAEEALLVEKIRLEQQRFGVAQSDWVGNEQQHEEEEEEEESEAESELEKVTDGADEHMKVCPDTGSSEIPEVRFGSLGQMKVCPATGSSEIPEVHPDQDVSRAAQLSNVEPRGVDSLSIEEMQDRLEQFTLVMQQKFLSGEDHQHLDYSKIDDDESLDDHWMREVNQDAEEKYFDDI